MRPENPGHPSDPELIIQCHVYIYISIVYTNWNVNRFWKSSISTLTRRVCIVASFFMNSFIPFFFNLHRKLLTNAIGQKNIYIMQCNLCSDENIPLKAFDVIRIIYTKSLTSCWICFLDRGQSLINARKHYHLPSWTFFASGEESISTRYWSSRIALIIFTINTHICWGFFCSQNLRSTMQLRTYL